MVTLETNNLEKHFSGVRALKGVTLAFEPGRVTAVVGPNGSGKTTLVNVLTGMTPITSGAIAFGDGAIERTKIQPHEVTDFGMTRTFQNVRLFEQMDVLENVLVALQSRGVFKSFFEFNLGAREARAEDLLKRVGLWEKRYENAENLSYGQRKLLEIARLLAMDVSIYFFDEPFAGLSPAMRDTVSEIITELKNTGNTVVLIEHNMDIIRTLCDHCIVLDAGELLAQGAPDEVLARPEVIEAYLGV